MGKRYYCEYCDKTMVSTPSIVRTHYKGLVHQKIVQEHYQQFKDPETILAEESIKKQCSRFFRGDCQFGSICRFSHYSKEQIDALKDYVAAKERSNCNNLSQISFQELYQKLQDEKSSKPRESDNGNTVLYDSNGVTHVFPWTYNPIFDQYGENLPPSLRKIKIDDFVNASITEWG